MYSSEDFERLFIRYKGEAYSRGESIQRFCHRNNIPYNQFEKWQPQATATMANLCLQPSA